MQFLLSIRRTAAYLACGAACLTTTVVFGQDAQKKETVEPVYRLSRNVAPESETETDSKNEATDDEKVAPKPSAEMMDSHPLDRAIKIAKNGLKNIRNNVHDYKAIMVKRERVNGKLLDPEYMAVKIRNRRSTENGRVPFSIYMKFLKPRSVRGQEVIYMEGWNNNKIAAHGTGLTGWVRVNLEPTSNMAMKNNRYPIYEAGIENLVAKLLEKGKRDRKAGPCEVRYVDNTKINGRPCTMIQVKHDEKKHPYEFHIARIFIDDELQIPVRYASYLWPSSPGGKPRLLEEYTYVNVELNVGLTDKDFDPDNPEYDYP